MNSGFNLGLDYTSFNPKNNLEEEKSLIFTKNQGESTTSVEMKFSNELEARNFKVELNFGEMLVF